MENVSPLGILVARAGWLIVTSVVDHLLNPRLETIAFLQEVSKMLMQ